MWLLVCLSFSVSSGLDLPLPAVNYLPRGVKLVFSFLFSIMIPYLLVIAWHGKIRQFSSDFPCRVVVNGSVHCHILVLSPV